MRETHHYFPCERRIFARYFLATATVVAHEKKWVLAATEEAMEQAYHIHPDGAMVGGSSCQHVGVFIDKLVTA